MRHALCMATCQSTTSCTTILRCTLSTCRSQWSTIIPLPLTFCVSGTPSLPLPFPILAQMQRHWHVSVFIWTLLVTMCAGKDCENITNFFFKKGVSAVMTLRELFDFITDSAITAENFEDYLDKMMEVCQQRPAPTAKESTSMSQSTDRIRP